MSEYEDGSGWREAVQSLADLQLLAKRYEDAILNYRALLSHSSPSSSPDLSPTDMLVLQVQLATALYKSGSHDEALSSVHRLTSLSIGELPEAARAILLRLEATIEVRVTRTSTCA